jgi:hypothetical protein
MCGFISDAVDWVGESLSDVGDAIGDGLRGARDFVVDTVENIIEDPLPTLVNVGLMAFGVPPVFAGMAAGATSAATNGGDILTGALTGGAMGYVGGAAASGATSAGLNRVVSGAIGGAASGATGAVLTGGDILESALGGAAAGGISAAVAPTVQDWYDNNFGTRVGDTVRSTLGLSSPNNPAAPIVERGTINGVPVSGPVAPIDLDGVPLGTGLKMNNQGTGFQSNGQNVSTGSLGNSTLGTTNVMPTGTSGSKYDLVSATGTGGLGLQPGGGTGLKATGGTGLQVGGNTGVQPLSPLPPTGPDNPIGLSTSQVGALNNTSTTTPPMVPLIPPTPKAPKTTSYGTFKFGEALPLEIPSGLNPGFIQPTAYYDTTDPTQAKYYWGGHGYQEGPEFSSEQYNNVPGAPTIPFGSQPAPFTMQSTQIRNPYAPMSTEGMTPDTNRLQAETMMAPTTTTPTQPIPNLGQNIPQYEPSFDSTYTLPSVQQEQQPAMVSNVAPVETMAQAQTQPMQQRVDPFDYLQQNVNDLPQEIVDFATQHKLSPNEAPIARDIYETFTSGLPLRPDQMNYAYYHNLTPSNLQEAYNMFDRYANPVQQPQQIQQAPSMAPSMAQSPVQELQPMAPTMQTPTYDYSNVNPTTYDEYYNMYTQSMGNEPINPADIQESFNQYQMQNSNMFAQPQFA